MSPRIVCGCGCGKTFWPRGNKKFLNEAHRNQFWLSRHPRRMPHGRAGKAAKPLPTVSKRVRCRRYVEVGSVRKGLEAIVRQNPGVFLRLAAAIPKAGQKAAA